MNTIESIGRDTFQERGRLADIQRQITADDLAEKLPSSIKETAGRDLPDSQQQAQNHNPSQDSSQDRWTRDSSAGTNTRTYSRLSLQTRFERQSEPQISAASIRKANSTQDSSQEPALDEADKELIQNLQQRDQEVRLHEQAHAASLGAYAGSISYTYQIGPNGVPYAVGGSTEVRPPSGNDPASKTEWGRLVRHAALAAGDPSAADASVAAAATRMETNANRPSLRLIA